MRATTHKTNNDFAVSMTQREKPIGRIIMMPLTGGKKKNRSLKSSRAISHDSASPAKRDPLPPNPNEGKSREMLALRLSLASLVSSFAGITEIARRHRELARLLSRDKNRGREERGEDG